MLASVCHQPILSTSISSTVSPPHTMRFLFIVTEFSNKIRGDFIASDNLNYTRVWMFAFFVIFDFWGIFLGVPSPLDRSMTLKVQPLCCPLHCTPHISTSRDAQDGNAHEQNCQRDWGAELWSEATRSEATNHKTTPTTCTSCLLISQVGVSYALFVLKRRS